MIVKIQVSLESSDGKRHMLVYNQRRTVNVQLPLSDEVKAAMGTRKKAYFEATVDGSTLDIGEEVMAQDW